MAYEAASQVSRRAFVGGAAAAALAPVCAGALSEAALAAAAGAGSEAGEGGAEDETGPIEPLAAPGAWDEEFDVVVCGCGGGLAGACRAAANGASVLAVDKVAEVGGASKEASVWAISGTDVQTAAGFPDITDDMVAAAVAGSSACGNVADMTVNVAAAAKRCANWMSQEGFEWQPTEVLGEPGPVGLAPKGSEEGGMTARAQIYTYRFLADKLQELGGDLRLGWTLTGLYMDGGAVVGVRLEDDGGNDVSVAARKGVLLATGGMCASRAMLKRYVPSAFEIVKYSTAGPADTGEGIRMGLGAGAQFDGFDFYDSFDGGIDGVDWNYYMYTASVQIARQPWLGITRFGDRYKYYVGGASAYMSAGRQLGLMPGHEGYVFFDSRYREYAPSFKQNMCRRLIDAETMPDEGRVPATLVNPEWYDGVEDGLEQGLVQTAGTLEELAGKLGLDPEKVRAAVEEWNQACAEGHDPLELMPDEFLHPVQDAPFYGMALGTYMFATHAGLSIDGGARVLDTKGSPIPGLYAAGCAAAMPTEPTAQANGSVCFAAGSAYLAAETMTA